MSNIKVAKTNTVNKANDGASDVHGIEAIDEGKLHLTSLQERNEKKDGYRMLSTTTVR